MIRPLRALIVVSFGLLCSGVFAQTPELPPSWPYVLPPMPPGFVPRPASTSAPRAPAPVAPETHRAAPLIQAEGSALRLPQTLINDSYNPPDWFPDEHPPMPDIVAHGKPGLVRACATCHLADGRGKPENAPLQGLPAEAFVLQIRAFQQGLRHSADPRKSNTSAMESYAKGMTEEDITQAANYYAAIKVAKTLRIIESETVPSTKIEAQLYVATGDGKTEPLGTRVMEIVDNPAQLEMRNPKVGYVAYVPVGSISRGKALATGGNPKVMPCSTCHGPHLEGIGPVPNLAGRSPTYLARQIYDIKLGSRKGPITALMEPVVAQLTDADIVDLVAYVASVEPR